MKKLQKEDLIIGEIYYGKNNDETGKSIFKYGNLKSIVLFETVFRSSWRLYFYENLREATPEEKHWLETCIKENKFVSYEDAMKTFKKSEFVLPEKWCIECNENIYDILQNYAFKTVGRRPLDKLKDSYYHFPQTTGICTRSSVYSDYTEITFEQFKKYVLKEQLEQPKDKVLKFKDFKLPKIEKVECAEGGIYQLGDKIKVFTHDSPNKGKPFTIEGFRWNNSKTKLCAITELHKPYGIGLDKIELYVESKVEPKQVLSLLEQAKLRYSIGTKFRNAYTDRDDHKRIFEITSFDNFHEATMKIHDRLGIYYNNEWLHYEGKWAEIVEDFVLPEKWCIKDVKEVKEFFENYNNGSYTCSNNAYLHYPRIVNYCYFKEIQKDYTEITFEQFKKYVLNGKN